MIRVNRLFMAAITTLILCLGLAVAEAADAPIAVNYTVGDTALVSFARVYAGTPVSALRIMTRPGRTRVNLQSNFGVGSTSIGAGGFVASTDIALIDGVWVTGVQGSYSLTPTGDSDWTVTKAGVVLASGHGSASTKTLTIDVVP